MISLTFLSQIYACFLPPLFSLTHNYKGPCFHRDDFIIKDHISSLPFLIMKHHTAV